ncbi:unnamed protein product, partial [Ectocarpus fasciculatus]
HAAENDEVPAPGLDGAKSTRSTVYVGNIPWKTKFQDIQSLVSERGPVLDVGFERTVQLRGNKVLPGRPSGHATVTFQNPRDARGFVEDDNGNVCLGGQALHIAWADHDRSPLWGYDFSASRRGTTPFAASTAPSSTNIK